MPPRTTLAPLPTECLETILECLQDDLCSLYQLLFVSHQFFEITVPILYRSPFRLAASLSCSLSSSTSSSTSHHYAHHSIDSAGGWARFLKRTQLLAQLLIRNLQIRPPRQAPVLAVHKSSLLDDSNGMENLEPLISMAESTDWSNANRAVESPRNWSSKMSMMENEDDMDSETWEPDMRSCLDQDLDQDQCPDLIQFDGAWGDGSALQTDTKCESVSMVNKNITNSRTRGKATGGVSSTSTTSTRLLMDYFYFYTHQEHRSIPSVLRQIYPGAGRRECDRFLAEIERAILMHNPGKIESIHIQTPSTVVPHLQEHLVRFERLSRVELLDLVWTGKELAMVHRFLTDHATKFPATTGTTENDDNESGHDLVPLALQQGMRRRSPAIRHVKYATIRSYWDDAKLEGQPFDPIQLIRALGPGLESIDSIYWPRTTFEDLETLDVRSLRTLRITSLETLQEDRAFSRPEFLSRCRLLRNLAIFSSSTNTFSWAVRDWNKSREKSVVSQGGSSFAPLTVHGTGANASDRSALVDKPQPLVQLQQLRVHGPTDDIIFAIIRDSLYSFRNSLQVLEARSDMECLQGEAEWTNIADELLDHSFSRSKDRNSVVDNKQTPHSTAQEVDDMTCFKRLLSISSGSLLIQWQIPHLSVLDLTGPIAGVFDVESLAHMPSLHTVCFATIIPLSPWVRRNPSCAVLSSHGGRVSSGGHVAQYGLCRLPLFAGRALKRVLIRGPWREINDRSLQQMVDAVPGHASESGAERWGDQLIELSVLNNSRVTIPGMIRLAQQMEHLEVMGTGLQLAPSASVGSSVDYGHDHDHYNDPTMDRTSRTIDRPELEDPESAARLMILKARLEMPWVDFGPDAIHLGRRVRRDGYLSRSWET
ncbi:hypothetical protein BG011_009931 [Mortierella polycephala]|uniref:F-box domain-containing protein n=1 Tax=Mortierella polycephala TaxID=41804 RepID=A0A9P6TVS5_9FUNG|nr:hypothetical protein BG011_009931 [Mortierella polycephala]